MATIDYIAADFIASSGAVDEEQLRQEYPLSPLGMPSTGEVVNLQVFVPPEGTTVMRLTTAGALDAPDIATSLAIVQAHTALGPGDSLTTGDREAWGDRGKLQNYLADPENLDAATSAWGNPDATVTASPNLSPSGTPLNLVTWDTVGVGLNQDVTLVEGNVYGLSFWARHVSGNNVLRPNLSGGAANVVIGTTFQQYHVDLVAGAGNALAFRVLSTVGAFEIDRIHLVDFSPTHVHAYVNTGSLPMPTATHGAVTSGDHVVSGDVVYTGTPNRHGASIDAANVVEIYNTASLGPAELAADGNMRVPLIEGKNYVVKRSGFVWPPVAFPIASSPDNASPVSISADFGIRALFVLDTSIPIFWGRDNATVLMNGLAFIDISNAGAGLGVTLFDLVSTGGRASVLSLFTCVLRNLKAVGGVVDMTTNFSATQQAFCESGLVARNTVAAASVTSAIGHLNVAYLSTVAAPDQRRPAVTLIGESGKSLVTAASINQGKVANSAFHIDASATGNITLSALLYDGPAIDGEFFRPDEVETLTAQANADIVITDFADSTADPGVDTTVNFGAIVDFIRGQFILIADEAAYDGIHEIVRVAADQMSFDINVVHSTSGAGTLKMVEHTVADCKFARDETVVVTGTTSYNDTLQTLRVTDTTFHLPQAFVADDATGTATSTGQDEESELVTVALAGVQKESKSIGFVQCVGNTTVTDMSGGPSVWVALNLGGNAVAGSNIELWGNVNATTGAITYQGIPNFSGTLRVTGSVTSSGGTQRFQFRAVINGVNQPVAASRDLSSSPMVGFEMIVPVQGLQTGQVISIEVQNTGGTSDILFQELYEDVE